MMTKTYDIGDPVRCSVTFATAKGTAKDPTTITVEVTPPSGKTIYTYGIDTEVGRTTKGMYYIDLVMDQHGVWPAYWKGTTACIAGESHYWLVRRKIT